MTKFTTTQVQALINEYKGNLFEFLVGSLLARRIHQEVHFLNSIPSSYRQQLKVYEQELRKYDSRIIEQLQQLSRAFFEQLNDKIQWDYQQVLLVGKLSHQQEARESQADIILIGHKKYNLSLKLCKNKNYVNTKSAGQKSFIQKYLTHPQKEIDQQFLNIHSLSAHEQFAKNLHQIYQVPYQEGFQSWQEKQLPTLPGQLNEQGKKELLIYYEAVNHILYSIFQKISPKELNLIATRLCGLNHEAAIQLICFHSGTKDYHLKKALILDPRENQNLQWSLLKRKDKKNSFFIQSELGVLQIRPKPMNSFIQNALKINCAISYY